MARRSDDEYQAMSDAFQAGEWRPVGEPVVGPGAFVKLKEGRPAGRREAGGNTPTTSVRLPQDIRDALDAQATEERVKPAEIIRRALVEYLERHVEAS